MTDVLPIDINRVEVSRRAETDFSDLKFGKEFSDHMFTADYIDGSWQNLTILPYGPMSFTPGISALHYGQAIFEGMKAHRGPDGNVRVFRPYANLERFNISAERLCMPSVPEDVFMGGLTALLQLDENWVPDAPGSSLYIRPFMFATDSFIGIRPSDTYKFVIFTCPVGAYYTEPVRVKIETQYSRSCEGGMGYAKTPGNYAGALYPTKLAQQQGYHQLLWTDARDHKYFEESGTMNLMFVMGDTLLTPKLSTSILAGVTRDSVVQIAKAWGMPVEERRVSVEEIIRGLENGELKEAFGVGTAAVIAHISVIGFEGTNYELPYDSNSFSRRVKEEMANIKTGQTEDVNGWIYTI
ncbi:MAG: branched-chain amino acid aminotransferase [Bacteroidota bacterium]